MDMEFGPDGSLYVVEWGQGFAENNPDSGVYRVDYISGARTPIAQRGGRQRRGAGRRRRSSSPPPAPTTRTARRSPTCGTSSDGTPTSTAPNPSHTYTAAGTYDATLTVTDESGATAVDTVRVVVGNQRPVVTIELPENGKIADFGDNDPVQGLRRRPDGSTGAGTIDCNDIRIEVKLGHDTHAHELSTRRAARARSRSRASDGHGVDANMFTVVTASYTDAGNGPAPASPAAPRRSCSPSSSRPSTSPPRAA